MVSIWYAFSYEVLIVSNLISLPHISQVAPYFDSFTEKLILFTSLENLLVSWKYTP